MLRRNYEIQQQIATLQNHQCVLCTNYAALYDAVS